MARDPYPNFDEHGEGAPYCGGDAVGCAVCIGADMLWRYNKTLPRRSSGAVDLIELGRQMGNLCRAQNGGTHGRALQGQCAGGLWFTCCIHLILRKHNVPSKLIYRTWRDIEACIKLKRPVAIPGNYVHFLKVDKNSYDSDTPAKGRSDDFLLGHMVLAWDVQSSNSDGDIRRIRVSDGDFGSASRPRKPPHSSIHRNQLKAFFESFNAKTAAIMEAPPPLNPTAVAVPQTGDRVVIHPREGQLRRTFWMYTVADGVIRSRRAAGTGGFSATCGGPRLMPFPDLDRHYTLVRITSGAHAGSFVGQKWVVEG